MRERRRTMLALALLLVAATWFHRPLADIVIAPALDASAPAGAQAAVDLGILGTVALSWTAKRLN